MNPLMISPKECISREPPLPLLAIILAKSVLKVLGRTIANNESEKEAGVDEEKMFNHRICTV